MKIIPRLRQTKTAHALNLLVLVFFSVATLSHAAEDAKPSATINWFDLSQASPPTKISELRAKLMSVIEPVRYRLFGLPDSVLVTGHFVSVAPATASQGIFPSAVTTNADGTFACILSPAQLGQLMKGIQSTKAMELLGSPGAQTLEGRHAKVAAQRVVQINGTNAYYGLALDILSRIKGQNVQLRTIIENTVAVTNLVAATANKSPTHAVSIRTNLLSALEAPVPSGGGLAIWNLPREKDKPGCLVIICPTIQTNNPTAPTGAKPSKAPTSIPTR